MSIQVVVLSMLELIGVSPGQLQPGMLSSACTPVAAFFEKGFYMAKKKEELGQACSHVLKDRDQL